MTRSGSRSRGGKLLRVLYPVMVACLLLSASAASAHRRVDPSAPTTGLEIPNLTHGEMAVVAEHAPAVRALAQSVVHTDPTFRRLANHAALQRAYCLWGLMPGSLADEESPFNECFHAYLATLRTLLAHMREMPVEGDAAQALAQALEGEMTRKNAASVLCSYSGEAFNTAEVIMPRWQDLIRHPPSMLALAGLAFVAAAGIWAISGMGRAAHGPSA